MKRVFALLLVLALALALPAALAEDDVVFAAPVDEAIAESADDEVWTDEIAKDVAAFDTQPAEAAKDEIASEIPIDASSFPDDAFRAFVADNYDTSTDGKLSLDERLAVNEYMTVNAKGIASLEGVKLFTELKVLRCRDNLLTSLDVSGMAQLIEVDANNNQLTSVNVNDCPVLHTVSLYKNQLPSLKITNCPALTYIQAEANQLTKLDVSDCPTIEVLYVGSNNLTELNVSHCKNMRSLWCEMNPITELDLSQFTRLESLHVNDCPITSVDVSASSSMQVIMCFRANLSSLIVTGNPQLYQLLCEDNPLTTIDLTGCDELINCANETPEDFPNRQMMCFTHGDYSPGHMIRCSYGVTLTANGQQLYPEAVAPEPVSIDGAKVTGVKNATYTGKAIKPNPVVKLDGAKLIEGTDYTVSYKNNKKIGKATVTITGIGDYTGTVKKTFKISPQKVAISKLTAGSKRLTAQWAKAAGGAGYQIQYGLKSKYKTAKPVTITKNKTVKKVIKGLKKGKVYYVRIRGYKKVGGAEYVSAWSKARKIKVK